MGAGVDRMLAAGLVDEVRTILAQGVPPHAAGLDGVGYREVVALLEGRLAAPGLRDAIVVATRRYAKRQETWIRNQLRTAGPARTAPEAWTVAPAEAPKTLARVVPPPGPPPPPPRPPPPPPPPPPP